MDFTSLAKSLQNEECHPDESEEPEFNAGFFNTNQSVVDIVNAVQYVDEEEIINAVKVLIKLGADPIELLLNPRVFLEFEIDNLPQVIARAMAQTGIDATDRIIERFKNHPDSRVKAINALTLGYIKDERAVKPLIAALYKDENWWVQNSIIRALGLIGDKRAFETLLEVFKKNPERVDAIAALGELQDKRVVETLIEILREGEQIRIIKYDRKARTAFYIRDPGNKREAAIYAAKALGKIGGKEALNALNSLRERIGLKQHLIVLKEAIIEALEEIKQNEANK